MKNSWKWRRRKKRKALICSLWQQKKIKMQEMRAETTEIDKQIAELESSKWTLNNFITIKLLLLVVS